MDCHITYKKLKYTKFQCNRLKSFKKGLASVLSNKLLISVKFSTFDVRLGQTVNVNNLFIDILFHVLLKAESVYFSYDLE